jgi:hypothetical protein
MYVGIQNISSPSEAVQEGTYLEEFTVGLILAQIENKTLMYAHIRLPLPAANWPCTGCYQVSDGNDHSKGGYRDGKTSISSYPLKRLLSSG